MTFVLFDYIVTSVRGYMKKRDVISLIRYHIEHNDIAFREQAYGIADDFSRAGDEQLGSYIYSLLSDRNVYVPQSVDAESEFLSKIEGVNKPLHLPPSIYDDIIGIVNATGYDSGINKFLFSGAPGTGKTESAKQLARILGRDLYAVNVENLIDSKLGQTAKNISSLFNEINNLYTPERVVILFDEIDSLALGRTDDHDLREMGRATSAVLKGFDNLVPSVIIIATTNLLEHFDKALIRRFDKVVDFNRYSQKNLIEIADSIMNDMISRFTFAEKNTRLFNKILSLKNPIPYPGDLSNLIRSSIAFSNPSDGTDYFRRLLRQIKPEIADDVKGLKQIGFTFREIEILSAVPKSTAARLIKGKVNE